MFAQSLWNGVVKPVGVIIEDSINPIDGGVQYLAGNTQISSGTEFLFQRKVVGFKLGTGIIPLDGFRNDAAELLDEARHLRRFQLIALVHARTGQRTRIGEADGGFVQRRPNQAGFGGNPIHGRFVP